MNRFLLYTRSLDKGEAVNSKVETESISGNAFATYVLKGGVEITNENRPTRIYRASPNRIGGGVAFDGWYTITALEDGTVYKCFCYRGATPMFKILELTLNEADEKTLTNAAGMAVISGRVDVNSKPLPENSSLDNRSGEALNVKALSDSVIAYAVPREE